MVMEADAMWWCSRKGQKLGPFTRSELKQKLVSGAIRPHEQLWTEGMNTWASAASMISTAATMQFGLWSGVFAGQKTW